MTRRWTVIGGLALAMSVATFLATPDGTAAAPVRISAAAVPGDANASGDGDVTRRAPDGRVVAVRPSSPRQAPAAVAAYAARVGVSDRAAVLVAAAHLRPMASDFGARPNELSVSRVTRRADDVIVVFQQRWDNLPVLGAQIAVWLDGSGRLVAALGKASPAAHSRFPSVSRVTARRASAQGRVAVARLLSHGPGHVSAASLDASWHGRRWFDPSVVSRDPASRAVPTALLRVTGPNGERYAVLSHLPTGRALVAWSLHPSIKRLVCDANRSIPSDTDRGVRCGVGQPYSITRAEGQGPVGRPDVDQVFQFFGDTSDFYAGLGIDLTNLVGADYGDGQGKALRGTVRICQPLQCPYANAFWNGEQMAFGEGVSTDDITAHELSHGVTERLAPLTYLWEAGAINESLSDIFGELVDLGNGSADDTAANRWLLGEGSSLGVIRSLKDPPAFGDPDRMRSALWSQDRNLLDNGGVHTNSGVGNKAAFLISDGGTFNGFTITGLGTTVTAELFEAARVALPTGADYGLLAEALRASCTSLALPAADCVEVDKVLQATEMDLEPAGGYPAQAPVCDTGSTIGQSRGTDFTTTAGFSLDARSWRHDSAAGDFAYSKDGTGSAMGVLRTAGAYSMTQTTPFTVPQGTTYLRMTHAYALVVGSLGIPVRAGYVSMEYSTNNGSTWRNATGLPWVAGPNDATRGGWSGSSGGWQTSRMNLSSLAGQQVRLRWTTHPSGLVSGAWWIDDASVYTCVPI